MRSSGRLCALLSALCLALAAYLPWLGNHEPTEFPARDLWYGVTGRSPRFNQSLAMLLLLIAGVAILALLSGWRPLAIVGMVATLGVVLLYLDRVHERAPTVVVGDLQRGYWLAVVGAVLLVLASVSPSRKRRTRPAT